MSCVLIQADYTYQREKQIKERMRKWKVTKPIKRDVWEAIVRKERLRSQVGKRSIIVVRGRHVSEAKLERYVKDHPKIAVEGLGDECEFGMTKLASKFLNHFQ